MRLPKKRTTEPDIQFFTQNIKRYFGGVFFPRREVLVVRAPARLDVLGGIAEDVGATSLTSTLGEAIILGLQKRTDRKILVRSLGVEEYGLARTVELSLEDFYGRDRLKTYTAIRNMFSKDPAKSWIGYIAGVFYMLLKERLIEHFECGVNIGIQSAIPIGMGLASSAALEIASMVAVCDAFELPLSEIQIAQFCQKIESKIFRNQSRPSELLTSLIGETDKIIARKNQPSEQIERVALPQNCRLVGINSMIRHPRASIRVERALTAAHMGGEIIFHHVKSSEGFHNPFQGYLCNITVEDFEDAFRELLPGRISGRQFLEQFPDIATKNISAHEETHYRVRSCVKHMIYENERARTFFEYLSDAETDPETRLTALGELMYESHMSYEKNCGLSSKQADLLVTLIRERGPAHGLYGARISSTGSGGTVVVLAADGTDDVLHNIGAQYHDLTGIEPQLLLSSSPGALQRGTVKTQFE